MVDRVLGLDHTGWIDALGRVGVDVKCSGCVCQLFGSSPEPHTCGKGIREEAGARGWMGTYTGGRFHFHQLTPDEVHPEDIAHHLAMRCRYGGAVRRFYSVAEHSVILSTRVPPEFARHALMHDATEAYVGDMIRPLKHWHKMAPFREAEAMIEPVIAQRFGIDWTPEARAVVDEYDDRILVDEISQLLAGPEKYLEQPALAVLEPLGVQITGLSWQHAEHVFTTRYLELFR